MTATRSDARPTSTARLPVVGEELIGCYRHPVPRYTSYPPADRFDDGFGQQDFIDALERSKAAAAPLAWYVHLPFCPRMCAYCGCNVAVSSSPDTKQRYLDRLFLEIERVGAHLGDQAATSLHFGGGTPNSYAPDAIASVVEAIEALTPFLPDAERSIEIDPRLCTTDDLHELRAIGLDRVSFGVQDMDERVQQAIGRLQSLERTQACVTGARRAGFKSINIDLIYGLPHQTRKTFERTQRHVLELAPDRIALFGYAHVPHLRKNQMRIDASALPTSGERLAIYEDTKAVLEDAGYVAIGLDHFALPDDELAIAQQERRLFRSFQGYTTVGGVDLVGVGMSAISCVAGAFAQSHKRLHTWSDAIDAGGLCTERGLRLTGDEQVRAFAIEQIMCNLALREADLVARFGEGTAALNDVAPRLAALEDDGLIVRDDEGLKVTDAGQPLVRHVAAAFDDVLHARRDGADRYSSAV